jgi:hypothetical protein
LLEKLYRLNSDEAYESDRINDIIRLKKEKSFLQGRLVAQKTKIDILEEEVTQLRQIYK